MKISTKEYMDMMIANERRFIDAQREWTIRYIDARFDASGKAVDEYKATNDERWVGANEFRGQLKDQAGTFVTRASLWLAVIAVIGVVTAIVALFIHH